MTVPVTGAVTEDPVGVGSEGVAVREAVDGVNDLALRVALGERLGERVGVGAEAVSVPQTLWVGVGEAEGSERVWEEEDVLEATVRLYVERVPVGDTSESVTVWVGVGGLGVQVGVNVGGENVLD